MGWLVKINNFFLRNLGLLLSFFAMLNVSGDIYSKLCVYCFNKLAVYRLLSFEHVYVINIIYSMRLTVCTVLD